MLNVNFDKICCLRGLCAQHFKVKTRIHWCSNVYMLLTCHLLNSKSIPKKLTSFLGENCLRERELCDRKQFQFQSGWSRLPDKMGSLWQTSLGSFKAQQHSEVSKIQNTKENYILFPSIWIVLRPSSVMWHNQSHTLREDHHHSVLLAINGNKTKPVDLIRQD